MYVNVFKISSLPSYSAEGAISGRTVCVIVVQKTTLLILVLYRIIFDFALLTTCGLSFHIHAIIWCGDLRLGEHKGMEGHIVGMRNAKV